MTHTRTQIVCVYVYVLAGQVLDKQQSNCLTSNAGDPLCAAYTQHLFEESSAVVTCCMTNAWLVTAKKIMTNVAVRHLIIMSTTVRSNVQNKTVNKFVECCTVSKRRRFSGSINLIEFWKIFKNIYSIKIWNQHRL